MVDPLDDQYVQELKGLNYEEFPGFVPIREELEVLAQHWEERKIHREVWARAVDEELSWPDIGMMSYVNGRIRQIEKQIGPEAVQEAR